MQQRRLRPGPRLEHPNSAHGPSYIRVICRRNQVISPSSDQAARFGNQRSAADTADNCVPLICDEFHTPRWARSRVTERVRSVGERLDTITPVTVTLRLTEHEHIALRDVRPRKASMQDAARRAVREYVIRGSHRRLRGGGADHRRARRCAGSARALRVKSWMTSTSTACSPCRSVPRAGGAIALRASLPRLHRHRRCNKRCVIPLLRWPQ